MIKNVILLVLGFITFLICFAMFYLGYNNGALTELRAFWYMPLPLGFLFVIIGLIGVAKRLQKQS